MSLRPKARGCKRRETSSAMLHLHGRLRYRVAVKKEHAAKVGGRFIRVVQV